MPADLVASSVSFGQYDSFDDFPDPNRMVLGSLAWAKNDSGANLSGLYVVKQTSPSVFAWSASSGSGGASSSVGVWRPGTPTVPGESYATFQEAYDACYPSRSDIVFDPTLGPCVVPDLGGPWDFDSRMHFRPFRNVAASDVYQFEIEDGAQVIDCAGIIGFTRCNVSPTAVYPFAFTPSVVPAAPVSFVLSNGAIVDNHSVTLAAIDGSTVSIAVFVHGIGGGFMDGPVLDLGATGTGTILLYDSAVFAGSGIARGTPGSNLAVLTDSLTGAPSALDLPGFTGALLIQTNALSANVAYSAFNPADWALPLPIATQTAIDRLAAAVAGLLGGPIP